MSEIETLAKAPRRRPVRSVWRTLLRLNRGYGGVDKAAHGALGFNTVVKVIGWIGLCAVIFILVQKVKEIELQIDPVERGLSQLGHQVDSAQLSMGSETKASQRELVDLQARARALKEALDDASREHEQRGEKSLEVADREAQELADQLARDEEAAKAIADEREALVKSLADYVQGLQGAKSTLATEAAGVAAETAGLADGGSAAAGALAELDAQAKAKAQAIAAVKPEDALGEVTVRAQALSARLASLEQKIAKLEAALPKDLPKPAAAPPRLEAASPGRAAPSIEEETAPEKRHPAKVEAPKATSEVASQPKAAGAAE